MLTNHTNFIGLWGYMRDMGMLNLPPIWRGRPMNSIRAYTIYLNLTPDEREYLRSR